MFASITVGITNAKHQSHKRRGRVSAGLQLRRLPHQITHRPVESGLFQKVAFAAFGTTGEAPKRQHRDDARDLLTRELDSPRYGRFIDDYLDFVRTDGAAVGPIGATQPHRVRDTAPSRIWVWPAGMSGDRAPA